MKFRYDIDEIIRHFLQGHYPDRPAMMREFRIALQESKNGIHLFREIAEEALPRRAGPVECVQLGVLYGIVLGVIMERERMGADIEKLRRQIES